MMDLNPTFLGEYSINENNTIVQDDSSKKFLHEKYSYDQELIPPIIMEYDETRFKDFTDIDNLNQHMFPWMKENEDKVFDKSKNRFKYDFFMSGRTFREILKCSYVKQPIKFKVVRVLNMYLIYHDYKFISYDAELEKMYSFMMHQFELCVSSYSSDDEEPDPYQMVYANKRHYHVLTGNIKDHKILYSSIIDCISKSKSSDEEIPIELFLKKGNPRILYSFNFQRGYTGIIPKTVVGFHTARHEITHLKVLETKNIPAMVQENCDHSDKYSMWKPHVCMEVAESLFNFIKLEAFMEERTVYSLTYDNNNSNNLFTLEKHLEQDIDSLPEWMTKFQ